VQATRRLDLNRHARLLVGARKASFAVADETVERTGMVPGGVSPGTAGALS
jgi:prolyl-tRNA editing enzyme YbaK/EbsC (Cys-tRNA(Pro) deacylase)